MQVSHSVTYNELKGSEQDDSAAPEPPAGEAERLVDYLRQLGFIVATPEGVLRAIEADRDEEELAAYRCVEGVAVSHASDGWWLLFRHDEPLPERGSYSAVEQEAGSC